MTDLQIAKPCHENWAAMSPNERGRHCAVCDKTVVDVTAMRPSEGRKFLGKLRDDLKAGAHVCVRSHADAAGRLLAPSATRRLLTNGLAAVLAVAIAGCQGNGPAVAPSSAQQPTTQTTQQTAQTPVPQQVTPQMMGEATATAPVTCITGDVAEVPPPMGAVVAIPAPAPQELIGRVAQPAPVMGAPAPQPAPQELMGKPVATPIIKGEIAAAPEVIKGKVAAPQDR